jgi:hypothetical protein
MQSGALGLYFACGALSMPLWLRVVAHWGLARSWRLGMLLSIAVFAGASQLGAGDAPWFLLVCALSGAALGSDLALPGALLAGVIATAGRPGPRGGCLLWLVELCHQAQPGPGRRPGAAPLGLAGLCARHARCRALQAC